MSDNVTVQLGENSPEYVAYLLMRDINTNEKKHDRPRAELLDLYAECLATVKTPNARVKSDKILQRR